jgi:FkbM family methyltransferase
MNALFEAFFTRINHYYACLPYNLNWRVKTKLLRGFLSQYPLSVIDIGARGGGTGELSGLSRFIRYVGFDADQEECRRLMDDPPGGYAEYRVYPYFIGQGGTVEFHLYSDRGMSSTYEINSEFSRSFLEPSPRLDRTVALPAVRLDDVVAKNHLSAPDLLKLDTQGSELQILRGASQTLTQTFLVEVEVEFYPMYKGQPLFADVDALLCSCGFELLYLNRAFLQRKKFYKDLSRGELIFGDALYGRSPSQLGEFSLERIAKYIILLCHYGHLDLAHQIYDEHPKVQQLCPAISRCFSSSPNRVRRGLVSQFDKLTCLLLHIRRTNHMFCDSDRSWPIR